MEIEEYFEGVEELAGITIAQDIAAQDLIESKITDQSINDLIDCRKELLTSDEENDLCAHLILGFFTKMSRRRRLSAFALSFDIQRASDNLNIAQECEGYKNTQKLFLNTPQLFDKIRISGNPDKSKLELIELGAINTEPDNKYCKVDTGIARLSSYLDPQIVNWARTSFPNSPTFIRLDPHYFSPNEPAKLITEATLVPANPRWLPNFTLRENMKEFAAYSLTGDLAEGGVADYFDFHVKHLRGLEVYTKKQKNDYLSMMIEELPRANDPNGIMVSRCIHLDTHALPNTPIEDVELAHLDLAINVYLGENRLARQECSLQYGKVQDATIRTHVFRIENVPFLALFGFCSLFLDSHVLLGEWLTDLSA